MPSQIENIALFPLNLFLLPGEYTQLYIFEERYKQLLADCKNQQMPSFGIVFTSRDNPEKLGSLVQLKEVVKTYPGGEMDVIVQAQSVFRLFKFNFQKEGKLYPGGEIVVHDEIRNDPASDELKLVFTNYLLQHQGMHSGLLSQDPLGVFDIASEIIFNDKDKLELALLGTAEERNNYLINYFRYLEIIEMQERSIFNKIYLN